MRTVMVVMGVAAVIAFATPARADRASDVDQAFRALFNRIDANGDGQIRDTEVRSFADRTFDAADADGDGRLTRGEFQRIDFGLRLVAERHDRLKLYGDARGRIWQRWRGPRPMTETAFRHNLSSEVIRAGRSFSTDFAQFKRARFVQDLAAAFR